MSNVSIFDLVQDDQRTFFKFDKIGDAVEGTYVRRTDGVVNKFGNTQVLIDLMQADGTVMTVAIGSTKVRLLNEMDTIKLGQIIGFKYVDSKPSNMGNPSKIIKVVHDPMYVNKAWLEERDAKEKAFDEKLNGMTDQVMDPNKLYPDNNMEPSKPATTATSSDAEMLRKITELASAKFGVTDVDTLKTKIMEFTGVALIPSKFSEILEKLS